MIKSYKDLQVWQAGVQLVLRVYKLTERLPKEEQFGLINQMRRAAVSVPANIAEGYQRQQNKELCRFLHIALGSLAELETYFHLCGELKYASADDLLGLDEEASSVGRMLNGLIASVRRRMTGPPDH